jgi:hypothetical protein
MQPVEAEAEAEAAAAGGQAAAVLMEASDEFLGRAVCMRGSIATTVPITETDSEDISVHCVRTACASAQNTSPSTPSSDSRPCSA